MIPKRDPLTPPGFPLLLPQKAHQAACWLNVAFSPSSPLELISVPPPHGYVKGGAQ